MIPVYQNLFGHGKGNCFSACLASIFELPLDAVPHFCLDNNPDWLKETQAWLYEKFRIGMIGMNPLNLKEYADDSGVGLFFSRPCYHLISGQGPRGCAHSVVGCSGKMVHDPHPDNSGLIKDEVWDFFVKM